MRRSTLILAAVAFAAFSCNAQLVAKPASSTKPDRHRKPPDIQPALGASVRLPSPNVVPAGFPVRLVLTRSVDPRKVKAGDNIAFALFSDFYYRDVLLAERGAPVSGTVRKAEGPRAFGKGSRLAVHLESLHMRDGHKIALRGSAEARGGTDFPMGVQATEAIFGYAVFPPALAVSAVLFAVPGKTEPLAAGSLAIAYVDRDTPLDNGPLSDHPSPSTTANTANLQVIRGGRNWVRSADLFCNGIPIAHLRKGRLLELRLEQGWYRFSVKPDRPALFYAVPGRTYFLLADDRDVTLSEPGEVNQDTVGRTRSTWHRTLGELLANSKPMDNSDIYSTTGCTPLKEEFAIGRRP